MSQVSVDRGVRAGVRAAFVLAVGGIGVLLLGAASNELSGSDVLLICTVTLVLVAGIAVMLDTMVRLTNRITCDFADRLKLNLCEMEATRAELRRTRDELVALQPKTDELAEEVAAYAAFHVLTHGATVAATGTEDTGTHNVTRFRTR